MEIDNNVQNNYTQAASYAQAAAQTAQNNTTTVVKTETSQSGNGKETMLPEDSNEFSRAITGTVLDNKLSDKQLKPDKALSDAIEAANKKLRGTNQEFQYTMHNVTKSIMVKVVNTETKEVVREVPPQKIQDMIAKMWELAGIIVDEKR